LWQDCCNAARMERRWGPQRARRLSRRLQQLEAMTSLDDLTFMPFHSQERADGVIEIAVDDATSLFMQLMDPLREDGPLDTPVIVSAVGSPSIVVT
jgi:hypothetical protein